MPIGFDLPIWTAADDVPELYKKLDNDSGRIGLGMWVDLPGEVADGPWYAGAWSASGQRRSGSGSR